MLIIKNNLDKSTAIHENEKDEFNKSNLIIIELKAKVKEIREEN